MTSEYYCTYDCPDCNMVHEHVPVEMHGETRFVLVQPCNGKVVELEAVEDEE